jgi:hypothetical protein
MLVCLFAPATKRASCPGEARSKDYRFFDIQIRIPKQGIEQLRKQPRVKVRAECEIDARTSLPVWLHLKGGSTFEPIDDRPNFSMRPLHDASPLGLPIFRDKFYLHNSKQDPSLLRDYLAKRIYRAMGVCAPKVAFADVRLNERRMGIYVACEAISKQFLTESYGSCDGDLFEGEFSDIPLGLLDESVGPDHKSALRACRESASLNAFDAFNLQAFIAAELLSGNRDGFVSNLNNYWAYYLKVPDRKVLMLMPHTCDTAFNGRPMARWQYSNANAVKELIQCSQGKEVLKLITERSSNEHYQELLSIVNEVQCSLLSDIIQRDAHAVNKYCKAFEALNASIAKHYHELRSALEVNDGRRQFWHDSTDPLSWRAISSLTKISYKGKQIRLDCSNVDQSAGIVLETFARAGHYRLQCRGGATVNRSKLQNSGIRLVINGIGTLHRLSPSTGFTFDQEFTLQHHPWPGLFNMERLTIQLLAENCDGTLEFERPQITPADSPL